MGQPLKKLLEVNGVSFGYTGKNVLDSISCDIREGERIAILGPNGCGKTTFINLVSGLTSGYKGSIRMNGVEISELSHREIARNVAIVPQYHEPVFPYPVREFILMGRHRHLHWYEHPGPEDMSIAEKAAEKAGVSDLLDRPYDALSGGEMQLVILARALAQSSQMLMLDEPNSHLDFRNRFKILEMVCNLSDDCTRTTLMTLHDPNDVVRFAERVLVFCQGKIIADGSPVRILNSKLLEKVYEVKVSVMQTSDGSTIFRPEKNN